MASRDLILPVIKDILKRFSYFSADFYSWKEKYYKFSSLSEIERKLRKTIKLGMDTNEFRGGLNIL